MTGSYVPTIQSHFAKDLEKSGQDHTRINDEVFVSNFAKFSVTISESTFSLCLYPWCMILSKDNSPPPDKCFWNFKAVVGFHIITRYGEGTCKKQCMVLRKEITWLLALSLVWAYEEFDPKFVYLGLEDRKMFSDWF